MWRQRKPALATEERTDAGTAVPRERRGTCFSGTMTYCDVCRGVGVGSLAIEPTSAAKCGEVRRLQWLHHLLASSPPFAAKYMRACTHTYMHTCVHLLSVQQHTCACIGKLTTILKLRQCRCYVSLAFSTRPCKCAHGLCTGATDHHCHRYCYCLQARLCLAEETGGLLQCPIDQRGVFLTRANWKIS